ncbi:MAG: DEAD/DEAH box helicase [Polyangiaceae bacterium]|nr:DEAD/DEAH box helicase [Polyangiaceae bacterium]
MTHDSPFTSLSPAVASALEAHGFSDLTPIQRAVLDPAHEGRDLRLFSKTGSGKTVAVGLVLAPELERLAAERAGAEHGPQATPAVVLIAPTRELAAQLARELTWLFRPLGASVCTVTGGASYVQELRALRRSPLVVVGTPGRLLDHLQRGSIDPSRVAVAVLDEADQMLDMGFREDLEAILGRMPGERRTHLVAATFSREVRALADRYQQGAVAVEGTTLGEANLDIAHVAHLVRPDERDAAVVNLLLLAPGERALIFVRTREGASELADRLDRAGIRALALSGELEQRERTRTLEAFRSGAVTTLVATDVAARGLDIADVGRVIHADPPGDPDTFVHRSGRTGRAGKKGTSVLLVPPNAREYVLRLLRHARATLTWAPAPGPEDVLREADARLRAELSAPPEGEPEPRLRALAESLVADNDPIALVTALLSRVRHTGPAAPLPVTPLMPPAAPPARQRDRDREGLAAPRRPGPGPRVDPSGHAPRPARAQAAAPRHAFVPFRVTWGGRHGADPRRLLALVCRRGEIQSNQVGAIHIGERISTVEIAAAVAPAFAELAKRPDARDPRIRIEPWPEAPAPAPGPPARASRTTHRPAPPRRGPTHPRPTS